jgi:DNA polymerase
MEGVQTLDRAGAESLIRWWRDAGVDVLVENEPRGWLKDPLSFRGEGSERSEAGSGAVAAPQFLPHTPTLSAEGKREALPSTLSDLLAWMRESGDVPEARWGRTRLLPAGDPGSDVMILVDMPEPGDAEAGSLLAGEVGELFDRMLHAIGRSRHSIWLAPIATVRKVGRVADAEAARLAAIARHQIALVAPKRLLIMGKLPNELLVGPDWAETRGDYHLLTLGEAKVETVATFHPRLLNERPKYKAEAWKDLQLLMKGLS